MALSVIPPFQLLTAEQELFDIVTATIRHFNLPIVVRVAGGWVRDKVCVY